MDENENILFVVIGVTAAVVLVLAILVWVSMKILSGQGRQGVMVHVKTATRKSSPSGDVELAETPAESDLGAPRVQSDPAGDPESSTDTL